MSCPMSYDYLPNLCLLAMATEPPMDSPSKGYTPVSAKRRTARANPRLRLVRNTASKCNMAAGTDDRLILRSATVPQPSG